MVAVGKLNSMKYHDKNASPTCGSEMTVAAVNPFFNMCGGLYMLGFLEVALSLNPLISAVFASSYF